MNGTQMATTTLSSAMEDHCWRSHARNAPTAEKTPTNDAANIVKCPRAPSRQRVIALLTILNLARTQLHCAADDLAHSRSDLAFSMHGSRSSSRLEEISPPNEIVRVDAR